MTIKEVKKRLKIKDQEIADMFGYSTVHTYRNSSAKPRIDQAIVSIVEKVDEDWKDLINRYEKD